MVGSRQEDLERIENALEAAVTVFCDLTIEKRDVKYKSEHDPVTEADRRVDKLLRRLLLREGEGWLSEETVDDGSRLEKRRVWVVDPLDGTHEYTAGIPEYAVSIGLVEDGRAVAGGICNPATGEMILGSLETGVTLNGKPVRSRVCSRLNDAVVLASRTEVRRGQWNRFRDASFTVRPVGSVAYKLAYVAVGLADATWTLVPKHEWDVAAGAALVVAAGGTVKTLQGPAPVFNRPNPLLDGLLAFSASSEMLFKGIVVEGIRGL